MPLKEYLNLFVSQFMCFTKDHTKVSYFKKSFHSTVWFNVVSVLKNILCFASAFWMLIQPGPSVHSKEMSCIRQCNLVQGKNRGILLLSVLHSEGQFHRPCHCWMGKLEKLQHQFADVKFYFLLHLLLQHLCHPCAVWHQYRQQPGHHW